MAAHYNPRSLPIEAFARARQSLQGSVPVSALDRLADLAQGAWPDGAVVEYALVGEVRAQRYGAPDQLWLHVHATAHIPLVCQRCMEPASIALECDRDFRFVQSEAQAEAEDDDADEDLLVLEREFDALALVEDELILALPPVPKHEQCPGTVVLSARDAAFSDEPEKPVNPFAVLEAIKTKK